MMQSHDATVQQARFDEPEGLFEAALDTWSAGGWAMFGIATIALLMFGIGVHVWLRLRAKGHHSVPETVWREWVIRPSERHGPLVKILRATDGVDTIEDMAGLFEQLRTLEIGPFRRDLRVMKCCVSAAPLVGLLGTVTGMLATFAALALGSGGDQTMAQVASGISEALVTTETGLVIAIPGLFMHYRLRRRLDEYEAFLAHVETVCTQAVHGRERVERRKRARQMAKQQIARRIQQRALAVF